MKIYIAVDMEGISGITSPEYTSKDGKWYAMGQRLMTADVNAAVRGAYDAGADEVIVADVHANSYNLLPEQLDPRALLLIGTPHQPRFPFLDKAVDGVFLLGYHAMAGTLAATLEHTMSSASWCHFRVNGTEYGELGFDVMIASESGVPVVMVSGDDKLCDEARDLLGGVETACVKQGIGRTCALCLSPEHGQRVIYRHAFRAVERLAQGEDFLMPTPPAPAVVTLTYKHTQDADSAAVYGTKRIDGYTVEHRYDSISAIVGGIWADYPQEQRVHPERV